MLEWNVSIVIIVILLGFLAAFIDAVVGGGGLIAGVAAYVKFIAPNCKIIGVEPEESASMTGFGFCDANEAMRMNLR